ncbi:MULTISPECIES: pyridoxamine 5'-phosphate oxidase family protein [Burkholderia]|uniref:Pyridoxamine 5'-phosphate oxidase family protein n=1 Tax=Burkholderia cepacia TaxID=292 RepID=A0AA89CGV5_BURCE|nr:MULTISPECIES: pyridoxamine 5'-phosphate oxidase family protein [Burkholderia]KGB92544.1 pyridoxamine 5'-phosphate oxidase family protein [Burkholderia cepacia]
MRSTAFVKAASACFRLPDFHGSREVSRNETLSNITTNADQLFQHAHEIVSHCALCFVSSSDAAGQINARVVEILEIGSDLTIRFMTDSRTRKALEISRGSAISLSFLSMADRGYVTLGTVPTVSADTELKRRIWKESLLTWFPDGPDDPYVIAVTCTPVWVEMWSRMRGIAPDPLGLNSVRLFRKDGNWRVNHTFPGARESLREGSYDAQ